MPKESGKKQSNKKIKHTPPGESQRNYKNKPLNERIENRRSKNTFKITRKDFCYLRNSRNGKNGLKNLINNATKDPMGNWHSIPPTDVHDWNGYDSSFTRRMNSISGSTVGGNWYLSPSKNNVVIVTEVFGEENGQQNDNYKIQKIRKIR